jgi:hypothetical protein
LLHRDGADEENVMLDAFWRTASVKPGKMLCGQVPIPESVLRGSLGRSASSSAATAHPDAVLGVIEEIVLPLGAVANTGVPFVRARSRRTRGRSATLHQPGRPTCERLNGDRLRRGGQQQ